MARERRRLLISQERLLAAAGNPGSLPQLALTAEESHYVCRVLRLRLGQELAIINGQGQLWGARLDGADARHSQLSLLQPIEAPEETAAAQACTISLAMALPKRDSDVLVRMACELGVDRLQPLIADRSVVGERVPRQRLEAILREATEQCERLWLPALEEPCPSTDWLKRPSTAVRLLATTRHDQLPALLDHLRHDPCQPTEWQLAIGPEGGWSEREEELAAASGWQLVSLGDTILRTATAAVAGITLLSHWRDHHCRTDAANGSDLER